MRKAIIILLALLVIAPVFAQGAAEKETTTVTVWSSAQGSNQTVFDEIAQTFNDTIGKEKGIYFEAVYQGKASDVLTKVNAASGTDSLPDIAMMDATAATDMNSSEYLVTVDKLGIDTSDIIDCAIASYSSEKGLLGLPFNASALLYYYNKTLYDAAGVTAPRTLDDMVQVAKKTGKLNADGSFEVAAFVGVPATFELSTFIGAQNGLSYLVNNRNGHDARPTEVLFGKEGTYAAFLEKWKAVYDTGYMNAIASGTTAEFTSGRAAALLASSSNLASIIKAVAGEFEVGVAAVPMVNEQATGGTVISGGALFSFTDSVAVKTVLEYLISPEVQAKWSEATGYVPVTTTAYETEQYKAFLSENPQYQVALDSLLNSNAGLANVWVPSAYSIYYSFQANIVDVLKEAKTIPAAVDEMVATIEAAFEAYASQN